MKNISEISDYYSEFCGEIKLSNENYGTLILSNGMNSHLKWLMQSILNQSNYSPKLDLYDNLPLAFDVFKTNILNSEYHNIIFILDYTFLDESCNKNVNFLNPVLDFHKKLKYFALENLNKNFYFHPIIPRTSSLFQMWSNNIENSSILRNVNYSFSQELSENLFFLPIDMSAGFLDLFDHRLNNLAFQPFSIYGYQCLLESYVSIAKQNVNDSIRAIFVDLDNTLWRGVIGDDGKDVVLNSIHERSNKSFMQLCNWISTLAESGIIVSIVSKNDKEIVNEALNDKRFPISIEKHIFEVSASWNKKSSEIQRIMSKLNFSEKYCVFIDDNPVEISDVKSKFSKMLTVRIDHDDPALTFFSELSYLRKTNLKPEKSDLQRLKSIKSNSKIKQLSRNTGDRFKVSEKTKSELQFKTVFGFKEKTSKRMLEMLQKTNQFNSTKKYKTKAELDLFFETNGSVVLEYSHSDKFSDHGIIGYVFGIVNDSSLRITNWVESCRVFNRGLEIDTLEFLMQHFVNHTITLDYIQSDRNLVVKEFINYAKDQKKCQTH